MFALFFLIIFGAMTAYVFLTLRRALPGPAWARALPALPLLSLLLIPLLRWTGHADRLPPWALVTLFTGMVWVFWFAVVALTCHGWNLAATLARCGGVRKLKPLRPATVALLAAAYIVVGTAVGYVEAGQVRLREIRLEVPRLPAGRTELRIVHLSDLHAGFASRSAAFAGTLAAIHRARPDLVVSSGDLFDPPDSRLPEMTRALAAIQPPLGKYAVFGNHEFYQPPGEAERLATEAGFILLRNTVRSPQPGLELIGVDDPAGWRTGQAPQVSLDRVLRQGHPQNLRVLLQHQPKTDPDAIPEVDLQLSGHTHNGQVFPFGLVVRQLSPGPYGKLVDTGGRLRRHISCGAGTWGTPLRFFAPPEVTLFVISAPNGAVQ
ncbi:MAG: metallophosphoesterase [Lentisphaeria bacterium]